MRQSTLLRSLFYGVACTLVCGCTYGSYVSVLGLPNVVAVMYRDSEVNTSDRGTLVGSIGSSALPGWQDYNIQFRSKDKKVRGFVGFRSEPTSPLDWDEPDWKGRAFSVALPPGEYEFYVMDLGNIQMARIVHTDVSLPFQIKRDEATYVGELKWTQTQHEVGLLRRVVPHPASFSISDRAARDIPVIQQRYPEVVARPLRIEIPAAGRSTY